MVESEHHGDHLLFAWIQQKVFHFFMRKLNHI
jgi:hypothetical protein